MSPITTHILDTATGKPASGVTVRFEKRTSDQTNPTHQTENWEEISKGVSDNNGRVSNLCGDGKVLQKGTYRLFFEIGSYFAVQKRKSFYPHVTVIFDIEDPSQHYHVPLLISGYGYSTYRGS